MWPDIQWPPFLTTGAILADSYIGKYKTIVYISMIYSVGNAVMAVTALPAVGQGQMWGPALGLLLIGVGTGKESLKNGLQ